MLVAQWCLILCNPVDCSPPGSSVRGILQERILEWVAIPFSQGFPNPGIKPRSPTLQADSLPSEPPGKPQMNRFYLNFQLGFCFFFFLTLQYCIGFVIYQHESATGIHVFPILEPSSHLPPRTIPLGLPSAPAPSIMERHLSQPVDNQCRISDTVQQPKRCIPECRGCSPPRKESVARIPAKPMGLFNKGKECLEDKTPCSHLLENVCHTYLPN